MNTDRLGAIVPHIWRTGRFQSLWKYAAVFCVAVSSGCTSLTNPLHGIPADRVPPQFLAQPKNNLVPVDVSYLQLEPSRDYLLDSGDILGIYIDGVIPPLQSVREKSLPPVHFPEAGSTLPPAVGYPVHVSEDGTLSVPEMPPLNVRGMTVDQVREKLRREYVERGILQTRSNVMVTVLRQRTVSVTVIREDRGSGSRGRGAEVRGSSDESASGGPIRLKAGQNDILHALMVTGGLPGVLAKNEVKVLRARDSGRRQREAFLQRLKMYRDLATCDPCACLPELPEDPSILRIPLRLPPGVSPRLTADHVRLEAGDIVYVESRASEVFSTGGLLPPGEHFLPRDYDLDILGAISLAGGNVAASSNGGNRGGLGVNIGQVPPGTVFILRQTPCNGQIIIEVDINKALNNPRHRPLIQAGDYLVLQHKCEEEVLNFGLGTFFTYGVRELFRN